jgi:hypothetical protein
MLKVLTIIGLAVSTNAMAQMNNIQGNWVFTCRMVASSGPIQPGQPGSIIQKQASIQQNGAQAVLVSPEATLQGAFDNTPTNEYPYGRWLFAITYPVAAQTAARYEFSVFGGTTSDVVSATAATNYYYDALNNGNWNPIGGEAFICQGQRQ